VRATDRSGSSGRRRLGGGHVNVEDDHNVLGLQRRLVGGGGDGEGGRESEGKGDAGPAASASDQSGSSGRPRIGGGEVRR